MTFFFFRLFLRPTLALRAIPQFHRTFGSPKMFGRLSEGIFTLVYITWETFSETFRGKLFSEKKKEQKNSLNLFTECSVSLEGKFQGKSYSHWPKEPSSS